MTRLSMPTGAGIPDHIVRRDLISVDWPSRIDARDFKRMPAMPLGAIGTPHSLLQELLYRDLT